MYDTNFEIHTLKFTRDLEVYFISQLIMIGTYNSMQSQYMMNRYIAHFIYYVTTGYADLPLVLNNCPLLLVVTT